jgi:hypothetical protein
LKVIEENIKISGGRVEKYKTYYTHRGPLIGADDKDSSEVLFGGSLPKVSA